MDKNDIKSIVRSALEAYLFELQQSRHEQPSAEEATSECIDYLDSNPIDGKWLLKNHLTVYSACCCYHKSLDAFIKEAHITSDEDLDKLREEREVIIRLKMIYEKRHLDFNNPLL